MIERLVEPLPLNTVLTLQHHNRQAVNDFSWHGQLLQKTNHNDSESLESAAYRQKLVRAYK